MRVEEQGQSVLCAALNLRSGLRKNDQIYHFVCNKYGDAVVLLKHEGILSVSEVVIITPQGNSSFLYPTLIPQIIPVTKFRPLL